MNEKRILILRLLRIFAYAVFLAGLIFYGAANHPGVTLGECLDAPELYDGKVIEIGSEAVVDSVYYGGFTIRQLGKIVPVSGSANGVREGEFILLLARFHKPASLEAVAIRIAERRRAKIWFSAIPALLLLVLFFRRFRFDAARLYFYER